MAKKKSTPRSTLGRLKNTSLTTEKPIESDPADLTQPDPILALESAINPRRGVEIHDLLGKTPGELASTDEARIFTNWRQNRINEILSELGRRRSEALSLYEPLEALAPFHSCMAYERIIRSGVGAGKSLCVSAEVSRAVTNRDPFGKWPKSGKFVCVGYDQDHIGKVIYPLLFKPGAFRVIRDPETGLWRSFRPTSEWDIEHEDESVEAPPLIPKRYIKGRPAWVTRGKDVFAVIKLTTGWEIWGYSSRAKPPQGFRADGYWFDEDIDNPEWVDEALARLYRAKGGGGRLIWSARPHNKNIALLRMSQRAWEQAVSRPENPDVVEFKFNRRANKYITPEASERLTRALRFHGSDVAKQMDEGEYTLDEWKVFPQLSKETHEVRTDGPEFINGYLPLDWTRYAVIDPGVAICAVLFLAVPPPSFGDFIYLEDELYIPRCTDAIFGKKMAEKCKGKIYHTFIIDYHGSEPTQVSGKKIRQLYQEALDENHVRSVRGSFIFGVTNKTQRIAMTHRFLAPREQSGPKIRVVAGRLPNFWANAEVYHRKRQRDPVNPSQWIITDDPDDRGSIHQMVNLQYACDRRVVYHEPTSVQMASAGRSGRSVSQYLRDKHQRREQKQGPESSYVNLGPGR